jgi:hypothetical protein
VSGQRDARGWIGEAPAAAVVLNPDRRRFPSATFPARALRAAGVAVFTATVGLVVGSDAMAAVGAASRMGRAVGAAAAVAACVALAAVGWCGTRRGQRWLSGRDAAHLRRLTRRHALRVAASAGGPAAPAVDVAVTVRLCDPARAHMVGERQP